MFTLLLFMLLLPTPLPLPPRWCRCCEQAPQPNWLAGRPPLFGVRAGQFGLGSSGAPGSGTVHDFAECITAAAATTTTTTSTQ
jgi:hypothetical protein